MKIEASGVVFTGVCSVQTAECSAKTPPGGPLTAMWTAEGGRRQIDVCGDCMRVMTKSGQWHVIGARVMAAPQSAA
jgi:hypothetical protein